MSRLYLLRHGTAEDFASDDASRELVEKGRQQIRRVAELISRMAIRFELVVSSPYARARQTAEELIANLPERPELRLDERLIYVTPVDEALGLIAETTRSLASSDGAFCAVGHEPLLSSIAAAIVGDNAALALRKGGLVEIELATSGASSGRPRGYLLGLLRPRHLR